MSKKVQKKKVSENKDINERHFVWSQSLFSSPRHKLAFANRGCSKACGFPQIDMVRLNRILFFLFFHMRIQITLGALDDHVIVGQIGV